MIHDHHFVASAYQREYKTYSQKRWMFEKMIFKIFLMELWFIKKNKKWKYFFHFWQSISVCFHTIVFSMVHSTSKLYTLNNIGNVQKKVFLGKRICRVITPLFISGPGETSHCVFVVFCAYCSSWKNTTTIIFLKFFIFLLSECA